VVRFEHLSEAQKRAYLVADNQLALQAGRSEELAWLRDETTWTWSASMRRSWSGFWQLPTGRPGQMPRTRSRSRPRSRSVSQAMCGCSATTACCAIIARIRPAWPRVRILLRADSGFAPDELTTWCEANRVDYVFGLAQPAPSRRARRRPGNSRRRTCQDRSAGGASKSSATPRWDSWNRARRGIGEAEHLTKGANPVGWLPEATLVVALEHRPSGPRRRRL
jgi:Transposase DDE domain group 1